MVLRFLLLTELSSLAAFLLGLWASDGQLFGSAVGLPFALWIIWSPTMAGWLCSDRTQRARSLRRPRPTLLLWGAVPLAYALASQAMAGQSLHWGWLLLVLPHLLMGPLGEELGWRGTLLPALARRWGGRTAALLTAVLWALWHLPLWAIESPHRQIPFLLFAANVFWLSVAMTALTLRARGSIWPAVSLHLGFNVAGSVLEAHVSMAEAQQSLALLGGGVALLAWPLIPRRQAANHVHGTKERVAEPLDR